MSTWLHPLTNFGRGRGLRRRPLVPFQRIHINIKYCIYYNHESTNKGCSSVFTYSYSVQQSQIDDELKRNNDIIDIMLYFNSVSYGIFQFFKYKKICKKYTRAFTIVVFFLLIKYNLCIIMFITY